MLIGRYAHPQRNGGSVGCADGIYLITSSRILGINAKIEPFHVISVYNHAHQIKHYPPHSNVLFSFKMKILTENNQSSFSMQLGQKALS